jgi:hypothetical protein
MPLSHKADGTLLRRLMTQLQLTDKVPGENLIEEFTFSDLAELQIWTEAMTEIAIQMVEGMAFTRALADLLSERMHTEINGELEEQYSQDTESISTRFQSLFQYWDDLPFVLSTAVVNNIEHKLTQRKSG